MKKIFLGLIFCFLVELAYSQQKFNKIEYNYVINGDTSAIANLYFNNMESYFQILNKKETDSMAKSNLNNNYTVVAVKNMNVMDGNIIENNLAKAVLLTRTKSFDNITYLVEEATPKINWSLIDEHKKINTLNCSKATGSFRGRNYTAWYTLDIPVVFGPYKFCGLPGLILEINDENNFVQISAQKIEIPIDSTIDFEKIMANYKQKITLKEFVAKLKMANSYGRQYMERVIAKMPKQKGVKMSISNTTVSIEVGESIEKWYEWEKGKN
jgi:GLPGLI family protein